MTTSMLGRWWAVADHLDDTDPGDLLTDDVRWSIAYDDRRTTGGRAELLAYVAERVWQHRRHRILVSMVTGAAEVVAGELHEHGRRIATFVATVEFTPDGRIRRYLAAASSDIAVALPAPAGN